MHHTSEKHQSSYEVSKIEDTAITLSIKPKDKSVTLPAKDSKTQTDNKVQHGSANNIGDHRTQNQRNTPETANLNTGDEIKTTRCNNEANATPNVQAEEKDPYFYEYLKNHKFIVFANNTYHCAICDISIRYADVPGHTQDPHHVTILEKHVARRKSNNVNTIIQETTPYTNKKTEGPVTEVKLTSIDEANETRSLETQFNECALTDKEDGVPNGGHDSGEESSKCLHTQDKTDYNPEASETNVRHKKVSKKAQKKAAKNKAAEKEATVLPKEVHEAEAPLPQAGGLRTNDTFTEERGLLAERAPAVFDELKSEQADVDLQTDLDATTPAVIKTEKLISILKMVSQVDSDSSSDDVVINNKYVLGNMSFILVVCTDTKADCVACGEELMMDHIYQHIAKESHIRNVEETLVVTSMEDEFIRQVTV